MCSTSLKVVFQSLTCHTPDLHASQPYIHIQLWYNDSNIARVTTISSATTCHSIDTKWSKEGTMNDQHLLKRKCKKFFERLKKRFRKARRRQIISQPTLNSLFISHFYFPLSSPRLLQLWWAWGHGGYSQVCPFTLPPAIPLPYHSFPCMEESGWLPVMTSWAVCEWWWWHRRTPAHHLPSPLPVITTLHHTHTPHIPREMSSWWLFPPTI